jgi:hypothetical protein
MRPPLLLIASLRGPMHFLRQLSRGDFPWSSAAEHTGYDNFLPRSPSYVPILHRRSLYSSWNKLAYPEDRWAACCSCPQQAKRVAVVSTFLTSARWSFVRFYADDVDRIALW